MKNEDFCDLMGEINEKYIAEAIEQKPAGNTLPFKKWIAIAACLALVLGLGTVAIAKNTSVFFRGYGHEFIFTVDGEEEEKYGYFLKYEQKYVPDDFFDDGLEGAEEALIKLARYDDKDYVQIFYDRQKAAEFIGIDSIILPETDMEHDETWVTVSGRWDNQNPGEIKNLEVSSSYYDDKIRIGYGAQANAQEAYRGHAPNSGMLFKDYCDIEHEYIFIDEETECLKVKVSSEDGVWPNYSMENEDYEIIISGYLVKDNIYYSCTIQGYLEDEARMEELFEEWLENFR